MLTEILDAPTITEASSDPASPHLAKIQGRFLTEGAKSANRRVYSNIAPWIERAQAKIDAGSSCDMRTCHEAGDRATEIVGKITKLNADGTYEGMIANTPKGHEVLPLIKGGYLKHVSLRARSAKAEPLSQEAAGESGWVNITDVDGFGGIDFTNNPGIESASVAVLESAEGGEQVIESFQLAERDFSADDRKKAAASGAAMPGGRFPIENQEDLDNAVKLIGQADDKDAVRAHIRSRAKALGLNLPDSWTKESEEDMSGIAEAINKTVGAKTETEAVAETAGLETEATGIADAISQAVESNTEETTETETETEAEETETVTEAGSLSAKSHIQAMHDHAVAMGAKCPAGGMDADGDRDGDESATDATVGESLDTKALIESTVKAELDAERRRFEEKLTEERASHERKIEEMLNARRKTAAITESDATAEVEKMSLGKALAAYTTGAGLHK